MAVRIETQDRDSAHLRQVLVAGEVVSWLTVLDMRIRLLGEPIRMGGIGGVNTKEAHRMKGYARRLLSDTVRYMTAQGHDVSMLFGIPNFYDKFGYAPCLPDCRVAISTRDAERSRPAARGYSVRPLTEQDYPFVVRLHNECNRNRSASVIREVGAFHGFRHGSDWRVQTIASVVQRSGGDPVGYIVRDKSATEVKVASWTPSRRARIPPCSTSWPARPWRCGARRYRYSCRRTIRSWCSPGATDAAARRSTTA